MVKKAEWPKLTYFFRLFLVISAGLAIGRARPMRCSSNASASSTCLSCTSVWRADGHRQHDIRGYADRLAPERTFYILLSALALMLVGNWYLMLEHYDSFAYPIYYLLFEISSELLIMHASCISARTSTTSRASGCCR